MIVNFELTLRLTLVGTGFALYVSVNKERRICMIGILLATHGQFANGIRESAEMLMGEIEAMDTICLEKGEDIGEFIAKMAEKIDALNDGDGVMIMVDILGGSPFNASAYNLKQRAQCECLTGLNLPMLLGALDSRDFMSLEELREELANNARKGIVDVRKRLG